MQRYELGDEGASEKFWEIWMDGMTVFMRFGKIDSSGQTKLKKTSSADAAQKEQDRFIAEKIKQGYRLVESKAGAKPAKKTKGNPDLEKEIIKDPSSHDGYQVYGDWLTEQGDPLGEFIAVGVALEKKNGKDPNLKKKHADLLKENKASWIGGLEDLEGDSEVDIKWTCGFINEITLGGEEYGESDGLEAWKNLRKLPTAKFIRDLEFRVFEDDDGQPSYAAILKSMVSLGLPKTLRRLAFDVCGYQISWTSLGDFSKLYPMLENLEELKLAVGSMKLGASMNLPKLKKLEIITGGLSRDNVKSVLASKWPNLETLTLYFGDDEYGCNVKIKDIQPIFDGKSFAKVKHLGLCNAKFEDEIAHAIVDSKIAKQLKTLDLSKGILTDAGAEPLVGAAKSKLSQLEKLDVSQGFLSPQMVKKLKAAYGKKINVEGQDKPDSDYRYVRVAE